MSQTLVFQAFVYLAAAVVAVPVAKRLGLGSALGYLLAGVIIGPFVLGLVGEEGQDVMHFAEFGVVLMLFLVGLELEPSKLWQMRVPIVGLGGLQVTVTSLVIAALCLLAGFAWSTSLAVGLTLALSSTAIVLQTLQEKGWMKTEAGQSSFSVLLFQDIAVIPMLAVMPLLAMPEISGSANAGHAIASVDRPAWLEAIMVVGVVLAIVGGGRYLMRPLFKYIAGARSQEMFIATSLLLIASITLAMNFVGLSPALGTFLAGVVLAESEYRHELESDIEPFKGLLLGLFFIAVGAGIDFLLLASQPLLIIGLVVALVATKFIILYFLGRFFKLAFADALLFSFALAQGGEFAFLLVSYALQNRVFEQELANLIIMVVVLSMVLTPILIIIFEQLIQPRLANSCDGADEPEGDMPEMEHPVIIAGFGRFGQIVSRLLKASGYETTLLDHDAGQIEMTGRFGSKVFYGDASRSELLAAAGAAHARLLVVAIDDADKAVRTTEQVKVLFPELKVLARAIDRPHAYELRRAGADFIARETFGSALATGEEALKMLGVPAERASRMASVFEKHDTETMYKLYEHWGDTETYTFRMRQNIEELEKVLREDTDTLAETDPARDAESLKPDSA